MPRQIIVLDIQQGPPGQKNVKAIFWFPIAQAKAYPKPTFQSALDPTLAGGNAVTGPELASLQAGTILEQVQIFTYPSSYTATQVKADLQQAYNDGLAVINSLPNPISFYGVSFDGTVWSA